ncbi:MAG: SUMF1/EgtB/PvdO family nonheme iron enzyme, partial [Bryobacterales bacterium]|nr:SUMF1/EgtB/PvdO family nonheme iron enzyme [Bryobacterales bacterium]
GLFTLDGASAVVVHGITNQLVTAAGPAEPGEMVVLYATGLGAVDRAQQSGQPASLTELSKASNALTVNIGGRATAIQFAGLTPGSVGLYQVNCTVPADVSGGLYVVLTMLGQSSRSAYMPVRGVIAVPSGIEFVQLQPGEFTMGCSPGDSECYSDESPAHRVRITKAFQIGKYEVTQEQWQAAMTSNSSYFKGARLPVEQVSGDDIQGFLQRLNARNDGYRYRLPTEAEWEYAARAATTDKYAGASALGDVAWYEDNSGGTTHPVGQKRPNAWGLYDMLGNVYEWCQDWYGSYSSDAADNPTGPSSGQSRTDRGGSFGVPARGERVSSRHRIAPGYRNYDFGFRCVREVAASSSCTAPAITVQPAGRSIASGSTADLTVTASGSAPLTYQWYEGAKGTTTNPVGTNSATFRTPTLTATTTYWARVTNACGQAESAAATVIPAQPCVLACLASGPSATTAGAPVSFTASATLAGCFGSPAYSWAFGDGGSAAQQNPSYAYRQSGSYTWTMTASAAGASACTQRGGIQVSAACAAPAITVQPAGRSIASGSTADLAVTASGSAPLTYQWYEGAKGTSTKPVGTNSAAFRTPAVTAATTYWVRVTNACGQADSEAATVSVATSSGTLPGVGNSCSSIEGALLFAHDGQYLGKVTSNTYDSESLGNKYGNYGDPYSSVSIFNQYGTYGGQNSLLSPFNPYTNTPPVLFLNSKPVVYLTANRNITPRLDPTAVYPCIGRR